MSFQYEVKLKWCFFQRDIGRRLLLMENIWWRARAGGRTPNIILYLVKDQYSKVLNVSPGRLPSTFPRIKPMVMEIMENVCTGGFSRSPQPLLYIYILYIGRTAWRWVIGEAGDLGHLQGVGGDHLAPKYNRFHTNHIYSVWDFLHYIAGAVCGPGAGRWS